MTSLKFLTKSSARAHRITDMFQELFLQIKLQIAQCLVTFLYFFCFILFQFFLLLLFEPHTSTCEWLWNCTSFNSFYAHTFSSSITFSHVLMTSCWRSCELCTFKCNYVFMTWKINRKDFFSRSAIWDGCTFGCTFHCLNCMCCVI